MPKLLTQREMALWTQNEIADIAADPFAAEVNQKVSDYVLFLAGHPDWTREETPYDVQVIVLWMFKRTYSNPDQEVASGVGPISSRVVDEAALGMALTDAERETLASYKAAAAGGTTGGLWTASIAHSGTPKPKTIYATDNQQINIDSTNAAPSWDIPFLDPEDVNHP